MTLLHAKLRGRRKWLCFFLEGDDADFDGGQPKEKLQQLISLLRGPASSASVLLLLRDAEEEDAAQLSLCARNLSEQLGSVTAWLVPPLHGLHPSELLHEA